MIEGLWASEVGDGLLLLEVRRGGAGGGCSLLPLLGADRDSEAAATRPSALLISGLDAYSESVTRNIV